MEKEIIHEHGEKSAKQWGTMEKECSKHTAHFGKNIIDVVCQMDAGHLKESKRTRVIMNVKEQPAVNIPAHPGQYLQDPYEDAKT